jgi:pantoate--beta-alanine ligase
MIVVRDKLTLRNRLNAFGRSKPGIVTGFVPTMGFLHKGHCSLIQKAREETDHVTVSIFVNPTQFAPGEDFDTYPRNEKYDLELLEQHHVDLVFIPSTRDMYPPDSLTTVSVSKLTKNLCGRYRPGHFRGVTTVVAKLFNLVMPQHAYFGQKDAQQSLVICRMVRDLDFPIDVHICPTVREPDGLAMSSRNVRLSPKARETAPVIYKSLEAAAAVAAAGEKKVRIILQAARTVMESAPQISIQYLECRDRERLHLLSNLDKPAVLATSVFLENVRLIDNIFLDPVEAGDGHKKTNH